MDLSHSYSRTAATGLAAEAAKLLDDLAKRRDAAGSSASCCDDISYSVNGYIYIYMYKSQYTYVYVYNIYIYIYIYIYT